MNDKTFPTTILNKKETHECVSNCMGDIIAKCSLLPEDKQSTCFTNNIKNDTKAQQCSKDCIQKYNTQEVESAKCVKWINDHPNVAPQTCVVKDFEKTLLENKNTMTVNNLITFIDKLNSCGYLDRTSIALFMETITALNDIFESLLAKQSNKHDICDFVNDSQLYQKIHFASDYIDAVNMVCMIGTVDGETYDKLWLYYSDTDIMAKIITIIRLVKKYIHELGKLYILMDNTFSVAQKMCTVRADVLESLKNYNIKLVQIFLNTQDDSVCESTFNIETMGFIIVVILVIILLLKN